MRTRPAINLVFVICLTGVLLTIPRPPVVRAQVTSCGATTNNQIGWSTKPHTGAEPHRYEGVSAQITARSASLCGSDHNPGINFSTAWTMIFGANGFAQSGTMFRYGDSCPRLWAEQTPPNSSFTDYYVGPGLGKCATVNASYTFWQQSLFVSGYYHIRSNVGGTIKHQGDFSSAEIEDGARLEVAFNGETYHAVSNVPGSPSAPVSNSQMTVQYYSDDAFHDTCGGVLLSHVHQGDTSRYGLDAPYCNYIDYWTN